MEGLIYQSLGVFFLEHEVADSIYRCFRMSVNKCTLQVLKQIFSSKQLRDPNIENDFLNRICLRRVLKQVVFLFLKNVDT